MSNYPHSTSKLLPTFSSSASSSSSDHHKLSRGSCTGLLFQLFDWNSRLQKKQPFRHKSLPAERPAGLIPKNLFCGNEKLSSAQMLNTPDEARLLCEQEGLSEDAFRKDQTPEKKRKKRSPNVVAKLMGLETMPSPDLRREKWPNHYQHSMPIQNFEGNSFVSNSRVPSSRRSLLEQGAVNNCSSRWGFSAEPLSQDSSHALHNEGILHDAAHCQVRTHKCQARNIPTMVAGQSSTDVKNGSFGCILSSSDTHNKVVLPGKNSLASKAVISEVANKALEQNMPLRHALKRVESSAGNNDNEKENEKKATQRKSSSLKEHCASSRLFPDNSVPHCGPKQDRKIIDAANLPTGSRLHAANNRQSLSSSSATNGSIEEDAVLQHSKQRQVVNEDKDSSKWHSSQPGSDLGIEKKGRPHTRRPESTRRQLNDANGMELQSKKPAVVKLDMDPSSSKSSLHHHESRETSSTNTTLSTITQNRSVSSSNELSKQRRLSSSGKAKVGKESKMKSDEGVTVIKLPYSRGAGTTRSERPILQGRIRASKCKSISNKNPVESSQEEASDKSCISKASTQESESINQETSRCKELLHVQQLNEDFYCSVQSSEDVLDEIALSEIVHDSDEAQTEDIRENLGFLTSAEITGTYFDTENTSSNISIARNTCQSSCDSPLEELRDTASSSCDITHTKKQTVSYSGKSTATILQELLSALNSSAKLPMLENEQMQQESEISGVTRATTKTTEDSLDASSSCIGEDDSNSLDMSASGSNVCQQYAAGAVKQVDFLGCENKCCVKDGRNCWCKWSKCMHNSMENYNEFDCDGQISNDVSQGTEKIIQSEGEYVDSIIRNVKLSHNGIFPTKLQATDSIVDPAIFNKLEETLKHSWEWRAEPKAEIDGLYRTSMESFHHDEDLAKDYRKLMFDCVQEALSLDLGIIHPIQMNDVPYLHLPQEACCRRVLRRIHDWKSARCGLNVDDMVEKAMNTGNGKWVDFSGECVEIAGEVEAGIYKDLIDELVLDLVSCFRMVPGARSAKTARLGGMERNKLIWVGL